MTTFHMTGRAAGKTTFLVDKVYREPDRQIVTAWAQEADRLLKLLVERCVDDGPPPWAKEGTYPITKDRADWTRFWVRQNAIQPASGFQRGGPRHVLIDNVGEVLSVLFGSVEAVTGTENVLRYVPRPPRIRCADCGGPYDEDNDALGLCADCLAKDDNWEAPDGT